MASQRVRDSLAHDDRWRVPAAFDLPEVLGVHRGQTPARRPWPSSIQRRRIGASIFTSLYRFLRGPSVASGDTRGRARVGPILSVRSGVAVATGTAARHGIQRGPAGALARGVAPRKSHPSFTRRATRRSWILVRSGHAQAGSCGGCAARAVMSGRPASPIERRATVVPYARVVHGGVDRVIRQKSRCRCGPGNVVRQPRDRTSVGRRLLQEAAAARRKTVPMLSSGLSAFRASLSRKFTGLSAAVCAYGVCRGRWSGRIAHGSVCLVKDEFGSLGVVDELGQGFGLVL